MDGDGLDRAELLWEGDRPDRGRGVRKGLIGLLAAFVLMAATSVAHAAFPGQNGKIAFDYHPTSDDIFVVEPDGSGADRDHRAAGQ